MKNDTPQTPTVDVCYKDFCTRATGFPAWVLLLFFAFALLAITAVAYAPTKNK